MKQTLIAILFFVITTTNAQTAQKNFIDQPYIELTGTVKTEVAPDEIYLNITINERDKRGKKSVEQQENEMIIKLKSLGIDVDKQLSVLDFDGVYLRKFLKENEVSKRKNYELLVNDGLILSKVFQALDELDISKVNIERVSHSEIEKLRREAKVQALKTAKEKAEDYTKAIDQKIGKALYIEEVDSRNLGVNSLYNNAFNLENQTIRIRGAGSVNSYKSKDFNFTLELQNISITASVLARFEVL